MMKPLQVYVEEGDLARLGRWAKDRGWTKSQAVRAALRALLASGETDSLLSASGMIDGLPPDASERFDQYLEETFVAGTKAVGQAK